MVKLVRTDSDDQVFIGLVRFLDADLAKRDGNDHSFYSQFNKIDKIKHVVVAYEGDIPTGCGALNGCTHCPTAGGRGSLRLSWLN